MKNSLIALALLCTSAAVQAQDYLVYHVEVIRNGKTDFSSDITIENGQRNPATFSNMTTYMPKVVCQSNATLKALPAQSGYQISFDGFMVGESTSNISMNYLYRNDQIGDWSNLGNCRFENVNGYIESDPAITNTVELGKRVPLISVSQEGTNLPPKAFQIFITLTKINRNISEQLPTGFSAIHQ